MQNAAHPALLLIHNKISPTVRRQLEECAGMDREDACFWKFRHGKAMSWLQMQSEAQVKLNILRVCGQLQNLTCPAHPLNRRKPVRPAACAALPDCPCGMSFVFRIATDDYIDNAKKDPYLTSLMKTWPYFSCSTLSYSIQPAGSTGGYRSKCAAGNKSIFGNACIQQCELNSGSSTLDELSATPSSIGSLIIQTSSVALTYLYLRTKTHEAVRTDDNPDKSGSQ